LYGSHFIFPFIPSFSKHAAAYAKEHTSLNTFDVDDDGTMYIRNVGNTVDHTLCNNLRT
jgi:hypothetical protein